MKVNLRTAVFVLALVGASLSMARAADITQVWSESGAIAEGSYTDQNLSSLEGVTNNIGMEITADATTYAGPNSGTGGLNVPVLYFGNTCCSGLGIFEGDGAYADYWSILLGGVTLQGSGAAVNLGEPTTLLLVEEYGTAILYVNGTVVASAPNSPNATSSSNSVLWAGTDQGLDASFNGTLSNAEVFTFTGVFSPSDLTPEPATGTLWLVGLGVLLLARYAQRRRAAC